ncbi:hypothetical protein [Glycomyces algeriensis]|uniref:PemK-like, MazF-like toxin of type II toxin-antitoxin system n=1 Tax=Glycomyces algeriensis TaxID=256037 RepID=A0A9W6GBI8_9ACTN|nr:hypothetical protein [Glycomyces algeriensis]MDA1365598.1 hypothetical protein [Glycomyces algeriensis]MDR7351286.1 hypothetical protein [Glycomyces algeriensis]GLI44001.1 hypothetical protein GALLR39Z86_38510 [Glycomyces algeriensis]
MEADLDGPLVFAVCLLGLAAIVIWIAVAAVKRAERSRRRRKRSGGAGRGPSRATSVRPGRAGPAATASRPALTRPPTGGPQPRERWWADFPHQDDPTASKARPCLILGYTGKGYWVLKCTTQAPKQAEWRVRADAARWAPASDKDGYIDLVPFHLPKRSLKRKLGVLDSAKVARDVERRVRWERAWDFIG